MEYDLSTELQLIYSELNNVAAAQNITVKIQSSVERSKGCVNQTL